MSLRNKLVDTALQWQERFGVAPSITSAISEYDAALLVGMTENEYSEYMQDKTAVSKGADFIFKVHPTFRVIDNCIQNKKTAEFIVYLNNHKQMYNYEQQFSISCLGAL